jgi:hypothetical protein
MNFGGELRLFFYMCSVVNHKMKAMNRQTVLHARYTEDDASGCVAFGRSVQRAVAKVRSADCVLANSAHPNMLLI